MYSLTVPYKNYKNQPRNKTVTFHLDPPDIMKLSSEFNLVFNWRDEMKNDPRDLAPEEVIPYFTAFEEILLSCWGELSEDGEHFRRGGRYDFEESACFKAALMMFVTDPGMIVNFLDGVVPKDMEEVLKKQQENISKLESGEPGTNDENAALRARLAALEADRNKPTTDSPES